MRHLIGALVIGVVCMGIMGCGGADKAVVEKSAQDITALQQTVSSLQSDVESLKSGLKNSQNEVFMLNDKISKMEAAKAAAAATANTAAPLNSAKTPAKGAAPAKSGKKKKQ